MCGYIYTYTCMYMYYGILFNHKKNGILPFIAMWIDIENIILSEVSQAEKDKYYVLSLIIQNLENNTVNIHTKQKQIHRYRKNSFQLPKGKWEQGRDKIVVWH